MSGTDTRYFKILDIVFDKCELEVMALIWETFGVSDNLNCKTECIRTLPVNQRLLTVAEFLREVTQNQEHCPPKNSRNGCTNNILSLFTLAKITVSIAKLWPNIKRKWEGSVASERSLICGFFYFKNCWLNIVYGCPSLSYQAMWVW